MKITRKNYLEVWAVGGTEYISRHADRMEAVESALAQPPGTYEIRVDGSVYMTTTVTEEKAPSVSIQRVMIGDVPHIRVEGLTVVANGSPQEVLCEVTWDEQSPVELYLHDKLLGRTE